MNRLFGILCVIALAVATPIRAEELKLYGYGAAILIVGNEYVLNGIECGAPVDKAGLKTGDIIYEVLMLEGKVDPTYLTTRSTRKLPTIAVVFRPGGDESLYRVEFIKADYTRGKFAQQCGEVAAR